MLNLIFERVNSDTKVMVINLINKLKNFKASTYRNNMADMLDAIEVIYADIIKEGSSHKHYDIELFRALRTLKDLD